MSLTVYILTIAAEILKWNNASSKFYKLVFSEPQSLSFPPSLGLLTINVFEICEDKIDKHKILNFLLNIHCEFEIQAVNILIKP